ncbi:MAG: hypothetical protein A2017_16025 [Lentisphaerae bacterium GWF2_44_16]|nr:MAG: hypothetical protein A2017_16025 [Lentisphaerae bacterium GWF2_44_16]
MPILVKTDKRELELTGNSSKPLSRLMHEAGISLDLQCGGLGICKKCAVELGPGEYIVFDRRLTVEVGKTHKALACKTRVLSENAIVTVPKAAILKSEGKIYDDFELCEYNFAPLSGKLLVKVPGPSLEKPFSDWERIKNEVPKEFYPLSCPLNVLNKIPSALHDNNTLSVTLGKSHGIWRVLDIETGNTIDRNLAAAIDIGTTTVVVLLTDMNTGKILAKTSSYNQQMSRADDVASRISAASSNPEQLKYMQKLVIEDTINPLIIKACEQCGQNPENIYRTAVSGNTVMSHLFLGLSPEKIGAIPFQPVTNIYPDAKGEELGLVMHKNGIVSIVPSISGYIGGDITSDIYISHLNGGGLSALIDLGTNSEMVLSDNGKLFACAAAAGPAFEGAGMLCGCRAAPGAIEHISFNSELNFSISVIGNEKSSGICGSAIIDFIAEAFFCGLINPMGRYDLDMLKRNKKYLHADTPSGKSHACVLVEGKNSDSGKPIIVTELDIEQILKAKAAVYAGLKTLLSERNYSFKDLKSLILAGGFAKYIDIEKAVRIGMLPEIPKEKVTSIGNGSLAGAYLSLIDNSVNTSFMKIIEVPKVISLNTIPEFETTFVDALMLPNFNPDEFPLTLSSLAK